jgi:hypothetical protein
LYLGDNLGHISIYLDNCFEVSNLGNSNILLDIVKHIFSFLSSLFKSLPDPVFVPANRIHDCDFQQLDTDFGRMRFLVNGEEQKNVESIKHLAEWDVFKSHQGKFLGCVSQTNQSQSIIALIKHFPVNKFHSLGTQGTAIDINTKNKTVTMRRTFSIHVLNAKEEPLKTAYQRILSLTRVFFDKSDVRMEIDFQNA